MRTSNLVCLGTPLYVFIHTWGFGSCTSSSKAVPPLPPTDCTENTSERNIRSALHWCVRPTAVDWVFKSCWEAVKQAVNITHRIDSADAEDTIPLDPPAVCRRVKMYVRIIADVPVRGLHLCFVLFRRCISPTMSCDTEQPHCTTITQVHLFPTQ